MEAARARTGVLRCRQPQEERPGSSAGQLPFPMTNTPAQSQGGRCVRAQFQRPSKWEPAPSFLEELLSEGEGKARSKTLLPKGTAPRTHSLKPGPSWSSTTAHVQQCTLPCTDHWWSLTTQSLPKAPQVRCTGTGLQYRHLAAPQTQLQQALHMWGTSQAVPGSPTPARELSPQGPSLQSYHWLKTD